MSGTWWVGHDELDDDQKEIIALPESDSFLVTGPPGSGKTNLLLLRANYLYLSGLKNIAVVTFTRPLREFIASGATEYDFPLTKIVTSREWQNDFLHQYGAHLNSTGDFERDRQAFVKKVAEIADRHKLKSIFDAILLDEAQDYTPEEIELFARLSSRLICVADERQKIYTGADPLDAIRKCVGDTHVLQFHYRNGKNICRVADEIAKGWDGYRPLAETSNYDEAANPSTVDLQRSSSLAEQAKTIVSRLKTQLAAFPNEYIGVLCPKKEEVSTIWEAIASSEHGGNAFLLHGSTSDSFPDDKQIVVTTFHAAKGLEFRAVHLAACESLRKFGNNRKMAFTAVTRTKTALSVYHTDDLHGYLEAALQVLKRSFAPTYARRCFRRKEMIYFWQCERRQFVDFISSRTPVPSNCVRQSDGLDEISVRGDEVVLVWKTSPTKRFSLPRAVIVHEGKVQDFLAWVSTYFRNIRPFTGHCRVESPASAKLAASSEPTDWPLDNRSVDLGLIVTEAIAYSVGHTDVSRLPFSAFTRPLSFAYAKAVRNFDIAVKGDSQYLSNVEEGWSLCRELSGQPLLDLSPKDVTNVWQIVLGDDKSKSRSSDSNISESLTELKEVGHISHERWRGLVPKADDADVLWQAMEGPREARVLAVERAAEVLVRGTKATHRQRAFAAGYLASRVQPGTLDHLSLLFPFVSELRESLLWFGACAGLSPETTVDNYGNGLGWLMRRDLGRSVNWLDRPTCDIAISELKTLVHGGDERRPTFRTTTSGFLEVEILPLLTTIVRWPESGDEQSSKSQRADSQLTLFKNEARLDLEVREILRRIEDSSMSLEAIRSHVERVFDIPTAKNRKRRK